MPRRTPKTTSELTAVVAVEATDLLALSEATGATFAQKKVTANQMANFVSARIVTDGTTFDVFGSAAAVQALAAATYIPLAQRGAANGVPTLDAGSKIPTTFLPTLAITSTSVVTTQAAMLALVAEEGDVAIRTDFTPRRAFILKGADPTVLANWEALNPGTTVTSINGLTGDAISSSLEPVVFSSGGVLVALPGVQRFPVTRTCTISDVRAMVNTAPVGASVIVDINKNGVTVYSAQGNRPTIAAAATDSGVGVAPNVVNLVAGDYLTMDIDQIGTTNPGSDLTVVVTLSVPQA